jgi:multicomponent K+:H+ antiporter subunit D
MTAYLTVASVGTLLIAVSGFSQATLGAALYYLPHSALAVAVLFLLAEQIGARRGVVGDRLEGGAPMAQSALLGALFAIAAVALIGLPPLAGFVGKVMILRSTAALPGAGIMWAVILAVGLLSLVGLMRAGSLVFWSSAPGATPARPRARSGLVAPLALVACGVALAVFAAPVKRYTDAAARQLGDRGKYATAVLGDPAAGTTRPFPAGVRTSGARP